MKLSLVCMKNKHENKLAKKIHNGLVGMIIPVPPSVSLGFHLSLQSLPWDPPSIRLQTPWLSDAPHSKLSHLRTLSSGCLLPGTLLLISWLSLNITSSKKTFLIILSTLASLWLVSFLELYFSPKHFLQSIIILLNFISLVIQGITGV